MLALWVHAFLMLVVLGGISWHRRWRATLMFPLYLGVSTASSALQITAVIGPDDWLPWLLADLAQRLVVLGVAIEMGARIFHRELLGGRIYTGRVFVAVLALGLVAVVLWARTLAATMTDRELYFALVEGGRRLALTSAAAFTFLALLVVSWLNWHLDPYHRDVGAGFLAYQWVYMLASPWPSGAELVSPKIWPVWVYGAVLLLWARAAWQPVDANGLSPEDRAVAFPWQKTER